MLEGGVGECQKAVAGSSSTLGVVVSLVKSRMKLFCDEDFFQLHGPYIQCHPKTTLPFYLLDDPHTYFQNISNFMIFKIN